MRRYEKKGYEGNKYFKPLVKGLKHVHIGKDIWLIGKNSIVDGKEHQVIYGPDRKEYHLWNEDVAFVNLLSYEGKSFDYNEPGMGMDRGGNTALEGKVKIYILTHILDKKENWCFDLTKIPVNGKLKVIYNNGTVKNIEFKDKFESVLVFLKDLLIQLHTENEIRQIHKKAKQVLSEKEISS